MDYVKEVIEFQNHFPLAVFETSQKQMYMHLHDCLEINYVCAGEGFYVIEEKKYEIRQGDIFIINNRERHMAVHDGSLRILVLVFATHFIWDKQQEDDYLKPFFQRNRNFSNRIRRGDRGYDCLEDNIRKIEEEHRKKLAGWQMFVRAEVMMFLAELYRYCHDRQEVCDGVENLQRLYGKIRPALDYIHEHYMEQIELEVLARHAMMNKNYLCTCFKEIMNMRIFEYIDQLRINQACILLKTSDHSITEISGLTGYNSISYFNRSFKKVRGVAPGVYRKSADGGEEVFGGGDKN